MPARLPVRLALLAAVLAAPWSVPARAGEDTAETVRPPRTREPDRKRRIEGVWWHASLDGARRAAAAAPGRRKARPVLWLRMLGELDGKT